MPLYEYQCTACHEKSEVLQGYNDAPLTVCATCGGPLKKLISSPSFQFKGSGWYVTDYARKGGEGGAGSSGSGSGGSSGSSGGDGSSSTGGDDSAVIGKTASSSSEGGSGGDKSAGKSDTGSSTGDSKPTSPAKTGTGA